MRLAAALLVLASGSAFADPGAACLARVNEIAATLLPAASKLAGVPITPRIEVFSGGQAYAWSDRARSAIVVGAACGDSDDVLASTVAHEIGHHVLWAQDKHFPVPADGNLASWLMSEGEVAASVIGIRLLAQAMPAATFTLPLPTFSGHLAQAHSAAAAR